MRLFLCGDVMTGRGIDQVMPNPCEPILHEEYVHSAIDYVRLAEDAHGDFDPSYVWDAAVVVLDRAAPDLRVNLETSITRSSDFEPKGINDPASSLVSLAALWRLPPVSQNSLVPAPSSPRNGVNAVA